ncbi:unnamed protein product, partial [Musa acuminata var. zebrina]
LLLGPLVSFFDAALSNKFRFLKPWESSLPLFDFLAAHAVSVRVLLCSGQSSVDDDVLARLPALELLVASSAGVDHIDLAACRRLGISVTNAGSAFTDDAADYAVGLFLDILHHISASDRCVRRGLWPLNGDYPLASKVIHLPTEVGIVGLGSIGSAIAILINSILVLYLINGRIPSYALRIRGGGFSDIAPRASRPSALGIIG